MTNIIFGIIWTAFTSVFAFVIFASSISTSNVNGDPTGASFNLEPGLLIPLIILTVFFIIGIVIIVSGVKKLIKDSKTKKFGIPCYGRIQNLQPTGTYVNEQPEYKAILDVINPNTNQVERIEEVVGFNYYKFPIGSFVMCKYYNGDINFENKIEPGEVPGNYKDKLKPIDYETDFGCPNFEFSEDREYVTIDGVKYKRV